MSGVGKGITTSSLGTLFKAKGYNVSIAKADPYLNVDAGTMNPTEHGEVFVLKNGLETDQDMGNYERFLDREFQTCSARIIFMQTKRIEAIAEGRNLAENSRPTGLGMVIIFHTE